MKNNILLILTLLTYRPVTSQPRFGFEQYFCSGSSAAKTSVTRVYYETAAKGYLEARYNYDAEGSVGLSAGRRFGQESAGKAPGWMLTPTVGVVAGSSQGFSLGLNSGIRFGKWNFSSSFQVTPMKTGGYVYSWSESGWSFGDRLYLAAALQQDCRSGCGCKLSPGFSGQLSIGSWNVPVYIFNPFGKSVWLLAGFTREWVLHKKTDHSKKSLPSP